MRLREGLGDQAPESKKNLSPKLFTLSPTQGPKVGPFWDSYIRVIHKRNYFGAYG